MTIKETLYADRTRYLKAGDELGKSTVRALIGEIEKAEKSGKGEPKPLTDVEVIDILGREVKKRRETAGIYTDAGVADRAERETAEADLIAAYLPKQLTRDEVKELVLEAIKQAGEGANLGQVMKLVTPLTRGRAEGKLVSEVVRGQLLQVN
jgi:uncharacterized protein YqeY